MSVALVHIAQIALLAVFGLAHSYCFQKTSFSQLGRLIVWSVCVVGGGRVKRAFGAGFVLFGGWRGVRGGGGGRESGFVAVPLLRI
jgi:hypothetical protein